MGNVERGAFLGHAGQMLQVHPGKPALEVRVLIDCIKACYECAQACVACSDACLADPDPKPLARCILLNQDCADACGATGRILSRRTAFERDVGSFMVRACASACHLCAEECDRHAVGREQCRVCAEACRRCERACLDELTAE